MTQTSPGKFDRLPRTPAGSTALAILKVMSAIRALPNVGLQPTGLSRGGVGRACRTLRGMRLPRLSPGQALRISYNSCRNRHCPKCQAIAAKEWLADRHAELLPVPPACARAGSTFMLFSPCRNRLPTSPITTRRLSIIYCSKQPPRPDHHRGRPQAPRRPHRAHRRAPHLGISADPTSSSAAF
jgi:hypothetical protein